MLKQTQVLVVGPDDDAHQAVAAAVGAEDPALSVTVEPNPDEVLARLRQHPVECLVVGDLDADRAGDCLAAVREFDPDLPVIILTDPGSDDAVDVHGRVEYAAWTANPGTDADGSANGGTSQTPSLAARVRHRVDVYRTERRRRFAEKVLALSSDLVTVADADATITYASPAATTILGYEPADLVGTSALDLVVDEHRDRIAAAFDARVADPDAPTDVYHRALQADGTELSVRTRAYSYFDDPDIGGVLFFTRPEDRYPGPSPAQLRDSDLLDTSVGDFLAETRRWDARQE